MDFENIEGNWAPTMGAIVPGTIAWLVNTSQKESPHYFRGNNLIFDDFYNILI